jgi:hypothetical protein
MGQFIVAHWLQAFIVVKMDASQTMGAEASASACDALSFAEAASPPAVASSPEPPPSAGTPPSGLVVLSELHACATIAAAEKQMDHHAHRQLMQSRRSPKAPTAATRD